MKRWWHYLLLGLFAWLLFLFLRLPAHVAYDVTASERQLPVEFSAMRGTLWDGEGVLQYQGKNATNSNWELSPWALLLGRYSASVELMQADGHVSGELSMPVGGGEVALSEVKGSVPMPLLQQYLPMIPIPLQGDVSLKLDELQLDAQGRLQRAEGRVVWHKAETQLTESLPLGDLQMLLHSREDGGIEGEIRDSGGPLQIEASLSLEPAGALQLTGKVKPAESASPALRNLLAMLGKPDPTGYYPLEYTVAHLP